MYISRLIAIFLAFWLTVDGGRPRAAESQALPDLNAIEPIQNVIAKIARTISYRGCMTPACMAVIRLNHIFDIMDDGEMVRMGDARYFNRNEPDVENKYLHRVLLDHPDRARSMCDLLTSLASRYGARTSGQRLETDRATGIRLVALASLMDGNGPPSCLPRILGALPQTLEANMTIGIERDLCRYSYIPHEPCDRISR